MKNAVTTEKRSALLLSVTNEKGERIVKKKILGTVLAVVLLLSFCSAALVPFDAAESGESVGQSQFAQDSIRGAAILHCFNWSYNEIKDHLPEIAAAGYTAVQTSPVQKPKSYSSSKTDMSDLWWKLYQPLTLSVADGGTWLGTKAELQQMCAEADRYNIKVVVDIVANHMANSSSGGTFSKLNSAVESDLKKAEYYHTESYGANDNSRYEMTRGHIGMPDLNTSNSHVQQRVLGLLKECVDCGVDGFRFDAAKHIELPSDDSNTRSDFWKVVIEGIKAYKSDVFCYGEILNTAATALSNYTKYIDVTDNKTGNSALSAANSGKAGTLASSTYQMGAGSSHSVIWAESHDTYMHDETSGISNTVIARAWAISGARAKSTSLYFARPNSTMGKASTDGGWKSTAVREINKFKNYFMGQTEYLASSGDNIAYIERGTTGVCIAKLDGGGSVSLTANKMEAGTYKDRISGNTFTVSGGKIKGTVGSKGVAVVYQAPDEPTTAPSTAPTTTAPQTEPTTTAPATVPTTTASVTEPTTAPQTQKVLVGDVNFDGIINVNDVTFIQRHTAEIELLSGLGIYAADCDDDGNVTIADATLLQKYLAEFDDYGITGTEKEVPIVPPVPSTYTVWFTNSRKWSGTIYCYYWSDAEHHMVSWPGEKMTLDHTNSSGQDIYTFEVSADVQYLIFSNKSSQTVNIPFDGTELKFYAKSTTDSSGKYEYGTW